MKKLLMILFCLIGVFNFALIANADNTPKETFLDKVEEFRNLTVTQDEKSLLITTNRQIYHTKRKVLNDKLNNARNEYVKLLENYSLDEESKNEKLLELEKQIYNINQEKLILKKQYEQKKKQIKKSKM